jgi:hypothetical protein
MQKYKNYRIMQASTQIPKESLRGQAMYDMVGVLAGFHCESKIKL